MAYHEACDDCCDKFNCKYRRDNKVDECQEIIDFEDMIKLKDGK